MPSIRFGVLLVTLYLASTLAVPLKALRSMVFLRSSTAASSQFPCVGVQLEDHRVLLSAVCNLEWPIEAHTVAEMSFTGVSGRIQLGLQRTAAEVTSGSGGNSTSHNSAVRVLRVDDFDAPVQLLLPVDATRPAEESEDANASILEVDADTLQVSVVDHLVFVDNSQCHDVPSFHSATSVCVRPREASGGVVSSSSHRWRFLVTRDASAGEYVLLGIGASASQAQEDGDSRSFTWVYSNILEDESPLPEASATSDGDRVLGPVVDKIDTHNEFIAGIREKELGFSICTGALIASRFVLTAAHCTVNHTLSWVSIGAKATLGKSGELLQVRRVVRHPKYAKLLSGMTHDVALLELQKGSQRTPIRNGYVPAENLMGKRATIMGYGAKDSAKTHSYELRRVEIPLGPANDVCAKLMNYTLDESSVCGGGEADKDSCAGDSGGPVVLNPGSSDQRVVATVSLGKGCGIPGNLGTYALLSSVQDFIEGILQTKPALIVPPYNPRPVRPPA